MFKYPLAAKFFGLIAISYWLLAITGCSPKLTIELWAKKNQDAALALGIWSASNSKEATALLEVDCSDTKQFKKKITDALRNAPVKQQQSQQDYYLNEARKFFGNKNSSNNPDEGFENWCRQYPKAAKRLKCHAKALCKTGMGVLNGTIKIN